ncbi:GtrA family protein [Caballeronia sp. LZ065]|uniref:GtrA family protein n=1 Tax=Caballeronia sp. LZ065 TaxID=3038571 RepID=UPI00285EA21D|nr:GtrA family protein [Caballeronia sp. LZ065]MDR5779077.1 GtrA family protein [Caballeronia sp. LZ065]
MPATSKTLMTHGLRNAFGQLLRYGLVGLTINLAGYLIFVLATTHGAEPKLTMTFLYLAGIASGFWANRNWTFKDRGNLLGPGLRYACAYGLGYLLNLGLLLVFVDHLHYSPRVIQFIAIFVVAAFLFVMLKLLVFMQPAALQEKHR